MKKPLISSRDVVDESTVISKILSQDAVATPEPEPAPEPEPTPEPEPAPAEDSVVLSADDLRELLDEQVAARVAQAEAEKAQMAAELAEAKKQLTAAADAKARARELLGRAIPTPSTPAPMFSTSGHKSPDAWLNQGRLGEWAQIHNSADIRQIMLYSRGGQIVTHRDTHDSYRYWLENRDALRSEVEGLAKAAGFLRGSQDASTARADIPEMLLTFLSNTIRVTHQARRVYWQFPDYVEDFTRGPGDNMAVVRWANLPAPAAEADFTLTPGTVLATNLQNLSETEVLVTLEEKGLGKAGVTNGEPVGIPEFWMARSVQSLENVVLRVLGTHYEQAIDLMIRSKYFATTGIVYNDNGTPTITPANVGTGDDGTMSESFLMGLYGYMSGLQVMPLVDGCYTIVMHTTAATQFKKSLAEKFQYNTQQQIQDLTNIFPQIGSQGQVTGYLGRYCNFHVFETNAHSLGAAGTEGAQNVTLGVGSTLTRTSIAFGRSAVCRAVGMPVEIRRSNEDDFGRLGKFIWLSHETAAALDVDPALNASQQLRVFQVRTTDAIL